MVVSETLPIATVKARFSEIVDRVVRQRDRVIVTRDGQRAALLVSSDDLEGLEETLAIMSGSSLTAQIRASENVAASGDTGAGLDDVRADLKRRKPTARERAALAVLASVPARRQFEKPHDLGRARGTRDAPRDRREPSASRRTPGART